MLQLSSAAKRVLATAAFFQAVSGFFVAKVPDATRPELSWVSALFVLGIAFPSFYTLVRWQGWLGGAKILAALAVFAILIESLGVLTGWPYGEFAHKNEIGWKFFGLVPWTVPFAWIPLVLGASALAARFSMAQLPRVLLAAGLLVAIDGVLDPGAVHQNFWSYKHPGPYFGVPASNFLGWFISGTVGSGLFIWLSHKHGRRTFPPALASSVLLTVVFWTSVCLFAELWVPAVLGVALVIAFARLLFVMPPASSAAP